MEKEIHLKIEVVVRAGDEQYALAKALVRLVSFTDFGLSSALDDARTVIRGQIVTRTLRDAGRST